MQARHVVIQLVRGPQRYALMIVVVVSLLVATIGAWVTRGDVRFGLLALVSMFYLAAPSALLLLGLILVSIRRGRLVASWLMVSALTACILAGGMMGAWVGGLALHKYDMRATRRYVAKLLPLLDAHHTALGAYPTSLDKVADQLGPPPWLLDGGKAYHATQHGFHIEFRDPTALFFGDWIFDSESRQ